MLYYFINKQFFNNSFFFIIKKHHKSWYLVVFSKQHQAVFPTKLCHASHRSSVYNWSVPLKSTPDLNYIQYTDLYTSWWLPLLSLRLWKCDGSVDVLQRTALAGSQYRQLQTAHAGVFRFPRATSGSRDCECFTILILMVIWTKLAYTYIDLLFTGQQTPVCTHRSVQPHV